jgi:hypothetical protein
MRKLIPGLLAITIASGLTLAFYPATGAGRMLVADKSVTIRINGIDGSGNYDILDPGSTTLSKAAKDKIKFCIDYRGDSASEPALVTLSGFTLSTNQSRKNPFGNGSDDDNVFEIRMKGNNCSKVSVDINSSAEEGSYKYTITATNSAGRATIVDPEVKIGR